MTTTPAPNLRPATAEEIAETLSFALRYNGRKRCMMPTMLLAGTLQADGAWMVAGRWIGGLTEPTDVWDMGNSGTAARLLCGILA